MDKRILHIQFGLFVLVGGQELSRDEGDIAVVLIGASISCG